MPRVELGSEKKTIKTSTYLVCIFKLSQYHGRQTILSIAIPVKFHSKDPDDPLNYLI